ncbi:cytochrome P450 [Conidiobolus coronatus NRRL 28638]|uniref:Cytochrome P450 n=1 Tax=Conidiobolus coronatus (strain ATCC 28846 / CBS 209.66 / NRRL 28638) TaxID=796925 RepID=A0A137NPL7_CONC2|nr:cytochrome P450 [Conidiobolus coronatus NRRL 28638]|eukprot:KXN64685.1 cytochrome P450 [Conidiobolus coronatus NRRL 28638]
MIYYFTLGLVIYAAYKINKLLKVPPELKNIPALPLLTFFRFSRDKRFYIDKMNHYFQSYFNEFGIVRVFTHLGWTVYIADAKICKEVTTLPEIFQKQTSSKNAADNFLRFFGASQVGSVNGEEWRKQRKIINPIFNQTWSTELFGTCAQDLIDEWEKMDGKELKVHDKIQRMTLDVFGKSIFDMEFKSVKNADSKLYNLYHDIAKEVFGHPFYILFPFLEKVPFLKRPQLANKLDQYHEFIQELIKLKQNELNNGTLKSNGDLISALVQSNENSEEGKLTMEEIRDNLNFFIMAGHDTTSNTLTGTLYYLARYPEIQDKLRGQVLDAMNYPKNVQIPTIDQLKNIPFIDMVIKESMRIMTTVAAIQRISSCTYTLRNGVTIPKNTPVFVQLWGVHHNPSTFPNPFEFNPNRFEDISSQESKNWQPFLYGSRTCIGSTFSLMEQRVTLAMLLQKFEFSISSDNPDYHKLRIGSLGIVRPKELSIRVKVRA